MEARFGRLFDVLLRHVAQCNLILRNFDLEIKCSLEVRLVKARESSSSIATLELGGELVVPFIVTWNRSSLGRSRLVFTGSF